MNENDWLRLTRYLTGECGDDERRETERWIAASPARAELADRLRLGWERAGGPHEPFDLERAWGEVVRRKTARSAPAIVPAAVPAPPRPVPFERFARPLAWRRWPVALAASVVLALGAGVAWQAVRTDQFPPAVTAPGAMRTVTTQPGQVADVYLSDGTHVRVGAASALRFPTTFGRTRDVYLGGEAYFDVVHDARRGFAVHTTEAVVRDIGTRFNVRAYPGGSGTEVVVAEGMASVTPAGTAHPSHGMGDSVVLAASDLARLDTAGTLTVARLVNVDDHVAWMRGQLVFADTPLRDVLPQLRRWYRADFVLGDSALAGVRLTAVLDVASLPDALRRLSALLDAQVERQGRVMVFHAKHRVG